MMTLTRETAEKLLAKMTFEVVSGEMDKTLAEEVGAALLAAWDDRDAVNGILLRSMDQVKTLHRAEAAEAKLAERDAENARLRDALASVANYTPDENDNPLIVIVRMAGLARAALNKEPKP